MATIADLAVLVRSKNAGPFWLTIDIMFDDEGKYRRVRDSEMITRDGIARMFGRNPDDIIVVNHDVALGPSRSASRAPKAPARNTTATSTAASNTPRYCR